MKFLGKDKKEILKNLALILVGGVCLIGWVYLKKPEWLKPVLGLFSKSKVSAPKKKRPTPPPENTDLTPKGEPTPPPVKIPEEKPVETNPVPLPEGSPKPLDMNKVENSQEPPKENNPAQIPPIEPQKSPPSKESPSGQNPPIEKVSNLKIIGLSSNEFQKSLGKHWVPLPTKNSRSLSYRWDSLQLNLNLNPKGKINQLEARGELPSGSSNDSVSQFLTLNWPGGNYFLITGQKQEEAPSASTASTKEKPSLILSSRQEGNPSQLNLTKKYIQRGGEKVDSDPIHPHGLPTFKWPNPSPSIHPMIGEKKKTFAQPQLMGLYPGLPLWKTLDISNQMGFKSQDNSSENGEPTTPGWSRLTRISLDSSLPVWKNTESLDLFFQGGQLATLIWKLPFSTREGVRGFLKDIHTSGQLSPFPDLGHFQDTFFESGSQEVPFKKPGINWVQKISCRLFRFPSSPLKYPYDRAFFLLELGLSDLGALQVSSLRTKK